MPASKVSDPELCWVVAALQPATVKGVAARLPIGPDATYNRLRHLYRSGLLDRDTEGRKHRYRVTAQGRTRIEAADLPPADDTDFVAYFSDRDVDANADTVLEALDDLGGEWQLTPQLADRLSITPTMTRNYLHRLVEEGAVELDDSGDPYKWRLTEEGRARLGEETTSDTAKTA